MKYLPFMLILACGGLSPLPEAYTTPLGFYVVPQTYVEIPPEELDDAARLVAAGFIVEFHPELDGEEQRAYRDLLIEQLVRRIKRIELQSGRINDPATCGSWGCDGIVYYREGRMVLRMSVHECTYSTSLAHEFAHVAALVLFKDGDSEHRHPDIWAHRGIVWTTNGMLREIYCQEMGEE